jgi:23S rRNA pseudouridine2457 synthase
MPDRYLLFYKPYDVLTQFTDEEGRNSSVDIKEAKGETMRSPRLTLKDFIPVPEVYPVGRLDRDSEGLLLLTNNGKMQHRLTDPRFQHPRTYWVQVERVPDENAIKQLCQGVRIQNYQTRPAKVRLLTNEPDLPPRDPPIRFRKTVPTSWLEMILTEGKNRQIRRMTAAVGFPTLRLVRVAIAHLHVGNLQPGEWRELTSGEVRSLSVDWI